ncbi:hypothetical protein ACYSNR_14430 [Enterococcus sp. LJL128]|uniref:hypothetical protein n=1 Tax=Enterococcus sp. LJL51 TaxID=3416656 RepID=UPI003CF0DD60
MVSASVSVNPEELSGLVTQLQQITQQLNEAAGKLSSLNNSAYYEGGDGQMMVELFQAYSSVRVEELATHYQRLAEYVTFVSETSVAADQLLKKKSQEAMAGFERERNERLHPNFNQKKSAPEGLAGIQKQQNDILRPFG